MVYVVTRFDFRAPGADAAERRDRYRAALAMARYAEESGQDLSAFFHTWLFAPEKPTTW